MHLGTPINQRFSNIDLAYIAGFFDGEGSVGIYRTGCEVLHLRTQLVQNRTALSCALFESLVAVFGGHVSSSRSGAGLAMNWQLNSRRARSFLMAIYPNLNLKREQAALAIWWQRSRPISPARDRNGRMVAYPAEITRLDQAAERIMKLLKKRSIADLSLDELEADSAEVIRMLQAELATHPQIAEPKTEYLDPVMANQDDLVEVVHTLRQVACVKG